MLIGYGASASSLDSENYFFSLSDSSTAYMTAYFEFTQLLNLSFVGIVHDANIKDTTAFQDLAEIYESSVTSVTNILDVSFIPTLLDEVD